MLEISGKLNLVVNLNQSLGFFYIFSIRCYKESVTGLERVWWGGGVVVIGGSVFCRNTLAWKTGGLAGHKRERRYMSARR